MEWNNRKHQHSKERFVSSKSFAWSPKKDGEGIWKKLKIQYVIFFFFLADLFVKEFWKVLGLLTFSHECMM